MYPALNKPQQLCEIVFAQAPAKTVPQTTNTVLLLIFLVFLGWLYYNTVSYIHTFILAWMVFQKPEHNRTVPPSLAAVPPLMLCPPITSLTCSRRPPSLAAVRPPLPLLTREPVVGWLVCWLVVGHRLAGRSLVVGCWLVGRSLVFGRTPSDAGGVDDFVLEEGG